VNTLTGLSCPKKHEIQPPRYENLITRICQEADCKSDCFEKYKVCSNHFEELKNTPQCFVIANSGKNKGYRCKYKAILNGMCGRHQPKIQPKTKQGIKSRMIRLYPTSQQRNILRQWFGVARKVYNTTSSLFKRRRKMDKKLENIRQKLERRLYKKKYISSVPLQIRDNAINDHLKSRKNAILKYVKEKKVSTFRFRKKKDPSQSIQPYSAAAKRVLDCNNRYCLLQLYSTYLPPIRTKEELPAFTSCRIVMKYNREFYLKADIRYDIPPPKRQTIELDNAVGLDPNVKNMFGYYSTSKAGIIGEDINDVLGKYNAKISRLQSIKPKVTALKRRKTLTRKIQRQYFKREAKRDDIHWTLIRAILSSYDTVILPPFEEHLKCKGLSSSTNQQMFSIGHSLFRNRIIFKAESQGKNVIVPTEEYTTKTCSNCGRLNLPSDRYYGCNQCNFIGHRDVNAAKNILMKGFLEQ
jgi:putative transposase